MPHRWLWPASRHPAATITRGASERAVQGVSLTPSPHTGTEAAIRGLVRAALAEHVGDGGAALTPGAAVIVEWGDHEVLGEARGLAQRHDCRQPLRRPLDLQTRFDLASITKAVATTAALMRLVGDGRLDLTTQACELIPEFAGDGKDDVTIAHLLGHEAGLAPWEPVYLHAQDRAAALDWVAERPLTAPPGQRHSYSDLGFMLLGGVLEAATGLRLDEVARQEVTEPLGLTATGYRPRMAGVQEHAAGSTAAERPPSFAATSCGDAHEHRMIATGVPYAVDGDPDAFTGWREHALVGEVNDGNAWHAFGGVAGHAGMFGTAGDLATLGRALLAGARGRDNPLAPPPVVQRFIQPTGSGRQALGWWRDPGDARAGGRLVGHSGFTGGRLAVDPANESVVVLLTNRQQLGPPHPDITPLWRQIVAALPDRRPR